MARFVLSALALLLLAGCSLLTPLPRETTLAGRLAAFPTKALPLERPVTIYWDDRQILRRIAQGRLAEMGGPLAVDIDHSLRILDFGKAVPAILASMPAATRAWLDAFVAGVNHYQATFADLPHEYALLGLEREPWRPEEFIAIGRLGSTDITWLTWFRLLPLRNSPQWVMVWPRIAANGTSSAPSLTGAPQASLEQLEIHRLPVSHLLGMLPVIGGRYRFGDLPAAAAARPSTRPRTGSPRSGT
jgi:penicillin amidase